MENQNTDLPNGHDLITWATLKPLADYCWKHNCDMETIMTRTEEVEETYRKSYYRQHPEEFVDYLFSKRSGVTTKKEKVLLTTNEYPYKLEPGLLHYVLWLHPDQTEYNWDSLPHPDLIHMIEQQFDPANWAFLSFRSAQKNRSIPSIPHYHVILKKLN